MNSQSKTRPTKRNNSTIEAAREPVEELTTYLKEYAQQRPEVVALWCFGIGFVLGWKLKPW